tara:strand:- start:8993 stop:11227 length:2235 start_codon:yes stop_codon:yes gene_type:complete
MADQNLKINITGDSSKLSSALSSASSKLSAFGSKMQGVGKSLTTRLTLPLAIAGGAAIKFASDFQESMNKVDVAFGKSKKEVKDFAKTTLKQFGIAEGSALDMAALFGDMATSMGLNQNAASDMSTSLVGLAGDLASFKNIGIEQATTALAGVFTGETESLKRLGIVMTEANLKSFAMEKGMNSNIKTMTQAQKVALRYKFIMESTSNAQGDFGRTSGGAANQMRIFQESMKELSAKFGQEILPAFTKLVTFANGLLQKFSELSPTTKKLIVIFAGVAAALGPVIYILGTLLTIAPAIGTALAFLTGPIGLVIAGLTAISVVIYKNWAGIKQALVNIGNYFIDLYNNSLPIQLAVNALIMNFKNMLAVGKFVFSTFLTIIKTFASNFITIFKGIGDILIGVFTFDKDKIVQGFTDLTTGLKNNFTNAFDAIKTDASILGGSVVDNFNEALKSKTIAKIVIPVEMAVSGGASTSSDGAGGGGGVPTQGAATSGLSGISSAGIQTPISDMIEADTARMPQAFAEQQAVLAQNRLTALEKAAQFAQQINQIISGGLANLASGIGSALGNAISSGGNLAKSLSKVVLGTIGGMAVQLGKLAIGIGTTLKLVKKALENVHPAIAIAGGIALVALGTLFKNKASSIGGGGGGSFGGGSGSSYTGGNAAGGGGGTAFANGGIVSGPTMGLVGEYPGARQNPEVIAPLNKLQSIIGKSNNGGNLNVTGQVRIDGQDLLIAIERANETAGRIY